MPEKIFNALFLCTGNSARSIMAEALLNSAGAGRFRAFSAGSHPAGIVHPLALAQIRKAGLPTDGYRSKSWDEFAQPGAPKMDLVFTVCADAAAEPCPLFAGQPATAHWAVADPARFEGTYAEKDGAFARIFTQLRMRIHALTNLPIEKLERVALQQKLDEIGKR